MKKHYAINETVGKSSFLQIFKNPDQYNQDVRDPKILNFDFFDSLNVDENRQ